MTPSERIAAAQARAKARDEAERQERAKALKRHQEKLRAMTKRAGELPNRRGNP